MSDSLTIDELIFCGEFEHSIDAQGRVAIPKEWRYKDRDTRFIIVPDKNFLQLYPYELFKAFLKTVKQVSLADRKKGMALAKIASKAQECKCDKQGRIKISKNLLEHAKISDQATLAGVFTKGQIWNTENWKTEMENTDEEESLNEILNMV